jgi:deazaflavin-dependent oxidoreductase (nitroreductase family)
VKPELARRIARFNKRVTNRVAAPLAPRLPGFGVVSHVGRKSGRRYTTPVNVFTHPDGFVIALTYGKQAEWVKNVVAAGGCELTTRGRAYRLTDAHVFHDERRRPVPPFVRVPLRLVGAADFMRLRRAT